MNIFATAPGAERLDISDFCSSTVWSGSYRTCARQLDLELFNPPRDIAAFERPNIPVGSIVEMEAEGELLFFGMAVTSNQETGKSDLSVTCIDDGRYLARGECWYTFHGITAEDATRQVCRDYGIEVGELAATGVRLTRKFHGVPGYKVIATLYTMAGEQTGRRYIVRFHGRKLVVKAKSEGLPELVIAPGANLISQTTTVDISNIYNQVAIYTQTGMRVHTIDNAESRAAYGTFRKILTQTKGMDAVKQAKAILEDNDLKQTISLECYGNTALVSGEALALVDAFSDAVGRFWLDSDAHTWKKGLYTTKLSVNFRNLMDSTEAGSDK